MDLALYDKMAESNLCPHYFCVICKWTQSGDELHHREKKNYGKYEGKGSTPA